MVEQPVGWWPGQVRGVTAPESGRTFDVSPTSELACRRVMVRFESRPARVDAKVLRQARHTRSSRMA